MIAALLLSVRANATDWQRCDNCTEADAINLVKIGTTPATRGIYSLAGGWWSKFEIYSESVGTGCAPNVLDPSNKQAIAGKPRSECEYQNIAYPIETSETESAYFEALRDLFVATDGTLKELLEVDAVELNLPICSEAECVDPGTTAYDVRRNFGVAQRVREYTVAALRARSNVLRVMDRAVAMYEAHVWGADATMTTIVVRFTPDNSWIVIEISPGAPDGTIVGFYDPNGNPIWERGDQQEGTTTFAHPFQVEHFLMHAQRIGTQIDSPIGPGGSHQVTCEPIDGGTGIRCRRGGSGS